MRTSGGWPGGLYPPGALGALFDLAVFLPLLFEGDQFLFARAPTLRLFGVRLEVEAAFFEDHRQEIGGAYAGVTVLRGAGLQPAEPAIQIGGTSLAVEHHPAEVEL